MCGGWNWFSVTSKQFLVWYGTVIIAYSRFWSFICIVPILIQNWFSQNCCLLAVYSYESFRFWHAFFEAIFLIIFMRGILIFFSILNVSNKFLFVFWLAFSSLLWSLLSWCLSGAVDKMHPHWFIFIIMSTFISRITCKACVSPLYVIILLCVLSSFFSSQSNLDISVLEVSFLSLVLFLPPVSQSELLYIWDSTSETIMTAFTSFYLSVLWVSVISSIPTMLFWYVVIL